MGDMKKLLDFLNAEVGRRLALAKFLNVSPSAISMWKEVPPHRVRAVSDFSGIPPEELRPDLAEIFARTSVGSPRVRA